MLKVILLSTIAVLALPFAAKAADMPKPGIFSPTSVTNPPTPQKDYDWGGIYGGVYASQNEMSVDPGGSVARMGEGLFRGSIFSPQAARYSRIAAGGKFSGSETGMGGYIGYNWVDGELVAGIELDYGRANTKGSTTGRVGLYEDTGFGRQSLSLTASNKTTISDYALVKARAGFAIDRFLPYAFVGLGVARTRVENEVSAYAVLSAINTDGTTGGTISSGFDAAQEKRRSFIPAGALGVGLDWALIDNVVLRAEYQYLALQSSQGQRASLNTGKLGVAAKF